MSNLDYTNNRANHELIKVGKSIIINIHVNVIQKCNKTVYLDDFDAIEEFISSWNNKHINKTSYFSAWLTYLITYQRKFILNNLFLRTYIKRNFICP